ncbi:hypothetical protein LTV02_18590 [Nocardia yamanashiensis]|uniref:DUF6875 domain-containing protein n=1 Tax=Nocardia yamanashiensis TaxID=209247 RepID=UPI000A967B6A|nr:hypothetical protein [Nocardia yamanashiensis]UGT45267.1 hypothetical protein LTV02_18590 [Nocardia yamanashiensis]
MSERVIGPRSGLQWVSLGDTGSSCPAARSTVAEFRSWADSFLTQPHDDLGRDGPVCPYVRPSIRRDLLWLAQVPAAAPRRVWVRAIIEDALELYPELPTGNGSSTSVLRGLVTVFPNLTDYSLIDEMHNEFKSKFVERGTMFGQFYPGCDQPGLWNKDFRPLDAPMPMLVVRSMMTTDFPFLVDRREWMDAYVRKFAPMLPAHVRSVMVARLTSRPDSYVPAYREAPDDSCATGRR